MPPSARRRFACVPAPLRGKSSVAPTRPILPSVFVAVSWPFQCSFRTRALYHDCERMSWVIAAFADEIDSHAGSAEFLASLLAHPVHVLSGSLHRFGIAYA